MPGGAYPALRAADSLTVKGAVRFVPGVVVEGDVTLEAAGPEPAVLSPGTYHSGTTKVGQPAAVPA